MVFNKINRKKVIFLIFFFLPGGFLLLSLLIFINSFIDEKEKENEPV